MRIVGIFSKGLLVWCLLSSSAMQSQSAVTYLGTDEWGGRLGDMLLMYVKAKWVAYQHKLPLLCKPFQYSDQLALHDREQFLTEDMERNLKKKVITCYDGSEIKNPRAFSTDTTFYQVHYFFNPPQWGQYQQKYNGQEIMGWQEVYTNKEFMDDVKKCIAPRTPLELPTLPKDKITVAVHIRTGEGFDNARLSRQLYAMQDLNPNEARPNGAFADTEFPLKFPPLQFYVDQIKRISEMCKDVPIYLHIYTDSKDPLSMMNIIEFAVNKNNITFDCRKKDNHHAKNVLEDIFAMAQYDCLIRSGSNYPQIPQLIGNHRIVICPTSCKWIGNALIIDEIGIFSQQ